MVQTRLKQLVLTSVMVACAAVLGIPQSAGATQGVQGLGTTAEHASAILPPADPSSNIPERVPFQCSQTAIDNGPRCTTSALTDIDYARSLEGVGPMILPSNYAQLTPPEQLLVTWNLERAARGLPAIVELSTAADNDAMVGALTSDDPSLDSGSISAPDGSIFASGMGSALVADYFWMYDDGCFPNPDFNVACSSNAQNTPGAWDHRNIILGDYSCPDCGTTVVAGAAEAVATSGIFPGLITWTGVFANLIGSVPNADTAYLYRPIVGLAATPDGKGYWEVGSDGNVYPFGDAGSLGTLVDTNLNAPIVGMAPTPDGEGYWLLGQDGGVFSFGDAHFYGSTGNLKLNQPVVGMAATPDGKGYWFVAADGGVFSYGDAKFYGSTGSLRLNKPVVGMAVDPMTGGYWLVASDGGIFSFNAPFFGSTGNLRLNQPIVGMEAAANGSGYRFVASDGGVFDFNEAFAGSLGGQSIRAPIVGMAPFGTSGYWLVGATGSIAAFGGAIGYSSRM